MKLATFVTAMIWNIIRKERSHSFDSFWLFLYRKIILEFGRNFATLNPREMQFEFNLSDLSQTILQAGQQAYDLGCNLMIRP